MIHSPLLKDLPNVEHGFGTRADAAWLPERGHAWLQQIHSDLVLEPKTDGLAGDGDAIVTTVPDLWVSIRTADCIPILLADPHAQVAAAVHAGWRGTKAGILAKTLRRMQELGAQLSDVRAAIGPGIGVCCYEVGPEVAEQFGLQGRAYLDLALANERQLIEGGLDLEQIWQAKSCTQCDSKLFHSFRRDKEAAGRMVSAIRLL